MEKIYEHANDLHVAAYQVYAKKADKYAYADAAFTKKLTAEELKNAFIKGSVVTDADGVIYQPISCKEVKGVVTVTYVTTDASSAAKLATVETEAVAEEG